VSKKGEKERKVIAQNRKARHDYFIEDSFEAGIMLHGSEVKSIRAGNVNIIDSFAEQKSGEVYMMGAYIAEYKGATHFQHHTRRPRKLLMHRAEIQKLFGKLKVKGYTLIPLSVYINERNLIKIEIGLAKGKKQHDKREALKERDWQRQKDRVMKE